MSDNENEYAEESLQKVKQEDPAVNSDDEELSDLDEEEIAAEAGYDGSVPIDEEVFKLSRHKKEPSSAKRVQLPKEKTRVKKSALTKKREQQEEVGGGEGDEGDGLRATAGTKKKKRASKSADPLDDIPDEQLDPEQRRRRDFERRIQSTGQQPKKRKKTNDDVLDMFQDDMVNNLREKMRNAAIEDAECVREGKPATSKLSLLPEVRTVLRKGTLADTILDNNLLEAVRIWLEPLPDASLPAYEIQKELFAAMDRLPIKTIHLRESGLGKVVIFYQKSKRPQLSIKRTVDKLVGDWTRPIMGRSDNYRDKVISSRSYRVQEDSAYQRFGSSQANAAQQQRGPADLAEASAIRRNRAHIPSANNMSYEVAPKSFVQSTQLSIHQRAANDENYKRMKTKLMSGKAGGRKSGVSIEGR